MAERFIERAEFNPAIAITLALRNWLQTEIDSTMQDHSRNAYLNDWDRFFMDLGLPFQDRANQNSGKAIAHYNRLRDWTLAVESYPQLLEDDYFLARQIFCAQMFISGAYRRQCFFQATDPADYARRRQRQGPVGIDLTAAVRTGLKEELPVAYSDTPWGRLQQATLKLNEEALEGAELVHQLGPDSIDREDSTAVRVLQDIQNRWVKLAVNYMTFIAEQPSKSFQDVPFLEAKSITEEPAVYYPFRYDHE